MKKVQVVIFENGPADAKESLFNDIKSYLTNKGVVNSEMANLSLMGFGLIKSPSAGTVFSSFSGDKKVSISPFANIIVLCLKPGELEEQFGMQQKNKNVLGRGNGDTPIFVIERTEASNYKSAQTTVEHLHQLTSSELQPTTIDNLYTNIHAKKEAIMKEMVANSSRNSPR